MAKGKYEMWQEDDNITLLGAWARDGLTQAGECLIQERYRVHGNAQEAY